jgi:hypothetical protein
VPENATQNRNTPNHLGQEETHMTNADREKYLNCFIDWIQTNLAKPILNENWVRPPARITWGMPPANLTKRRSSKNGSALGVCFSRVATSDGVNEIFINPTMTDQDQILFVTLHELCHAEDNNRSGHSGRFARNITALGGIPPHTHGTPSDDLKAVFNQFRDEYGPFPAPPLNVDKLDKPKKQTTRMRKLECKQCGWLARVSTAQASRLYHGSVCPCCDRAGVLALDGELITNMHT